MIKKTKYHLMALLFPLAIFAQDSEIKPTEIKISYLDSIKSTFVNDNLAACVDSLWMNELTNLDLYNQLETDIATINLDQSVEYELPTELLKARLKEMDAKSPFNIEYNQSLENLIKSFLKNRKKSYERLMAISEYYFPLFENALAKQNVPLEIKYLAVVESALNPKAVSRVGATGLWQFMYQTGKEYNLNIDSYVDDRSDPLKSSEAATQYMTNMYKIFGDWDLVLASYNSGPGNVAKAIRRSAGQQNFWNIRKHLPKETQGYVPAFLATMYIYEYHKEHGIHPDRAIVKHFETDTVMIKKQLSFKQISALLDIPVVELQMLNPQYKINVIPAYTDKNHYLRLPKAQIAVFTSNEDKIYAYAQHELDQKERPYSSQQAIASRDGSESKIKYHKVRRGDSLGEIANRYDVTISEIKKWNKLKSSKAPLGRNLKIITNEALAYNDSKEEKAKTASEESDIASTNNQSTSPKVFKEEKVVTYKDVTKFHKVKSGDNLGEISDKYSVSVADLKKWNKLKGSNISVGDKLKIITNERVVTTVKKEVRQEVIASSEKHNKTPEVDTAVAVTDNFYIVQQGDNLSSIAKKNNVSVEDLKKWNNLSDNTIQLESKLKIAAISNENKPESSPITEVRNVEYVVQKGDNLGNIANKNGVSVSDLKLWNNLSDDNLKIGTNIIVAKKLMIDSNQSLAQNSGKKEKDSNPKKESHYYVQKGDSLFSIAKKYPGITISDIKKWNGIKDNNLKPGMKLKING